MLGRDFVHRLHIPGDDWIWVRYCEIELGTSFGYYSLHGRVSFNNRRKLRLLCLIQFLLFVGHLCLSGVRLGVDPRTDIKTTCVEKKLN